MPLRATALYCYTPYICICHVFYVGIDSKFYSKIHRQKPVERVIKYGFVTKDGTKICTVCIYYLINEIYSIELN